MKTNEILKKCTYIDITNLITDQAKRFPFYIEKFGYCSSNKFLVEDITNIDDILVLFSLSSNVECYRQKDIFYLNAYDLVISACHIPIHFNAVGHEKWNYFYIIFGGLKARFFYNLIRPSDNIIRINPLSRVTDIFIDLTKLCYDGSALSSMYQSLKIHDLLYELYKVSHNIAECKRLVPVRDTDVNTAINYISNHYQERLSIDTICNKVCLSKFYFCKIFKEHTGTTVYQYINEFRINKSKELLSYSKLPINDIGTAVGFKNGITFIHNFEKFVHMKPSEYRKNF